MSPGISSGYIIKGGHQPIFYRGCQVGFAEPGRCVMYHQEFNPHNNREHWPEKDHFKDPDTFLQKLKNNPQKTLEDIYKNIIEERLVGGNWLPYYNSWYVFCDGVLCSN